MHLAITVGNYQAVIELLEYGFSIEDCSNNLAPFELFGLFNRRISDEFTDKIIQYIPDIDITLSNGLSLSSMFQLTPLLLEKTKNSMFAFRKDDISNWNTREWMEEEWRVFNDKFNPNKAHIAIINYHPLKQVVCSMLAKLIKSVNTIYNHILKNSIHPCLYFFSSAECTLGSMKSS